MTIDKYYLLFVINQIVIDIEQRISQRFQENAFCNVSYATLTYIGGDGLYLHNRTNTQEGKN